MSGITTTGATIISDLDNSPKSILLWKTYAVVGRDWNSSHGYYNSSLLKVGGMQLFKMEGPDSTEKILPRTVDWQL